MLIHNYTGKCPTNTLEVNPVQYSCQVGCQYCLVNDGEHHTRPGVIYVDYDEYLRQHLASSGAKKIFYYFSPKSEAFQEATLETGLAHRILLEFVRHFREKPDSLVRVFIATKAGTRQLHHRFKGTSILELLHALKGRVQFNPSVGIMPDMLFDLLEPNAASAEDRLEAALACQEMGIKSDSVLTQPILLPFLSEDAMSRYFDLLARHNIFNFKPEFLTVSTRNLAVLAQLVGVYDREMERNLYELYLGPSNRDHIKQRERRAPDRQASRAYLEKLLHHASLRGITASICHWVRQELQVTASMIPVINKNGYQCLGYQTNLFHEVH